MSGHTTSGQNGAPEVGGATTSPEEEMARIDALLERGRATQAKVDDFYRAHSLLPGFGEKMLTSDTVPQHHQVVFRRLIEELSMMEQRIAHLECLASPSVPAARTRAVGNRYRI